jgi:hypothetical protein
MVIILNGLVWHLHSQSLWWISSLDLSRSNEYQDCSMIARLGLIDTLDLQGIHLFDCSERWK